VNQDHTKRKLPTILNADVVGYSQLIGDNEAPIVETIWTHNGGIYVNDW
jgi:hypothetical protein